MALRSASLGLGLAPGDELKYVYDFGDWIEHKITLEAITEPQADVKYPRWWGRISRSTRTANVVLRRGGRRGQPGSVTIVPRNKVAWSCAAKTA